VGVSDPGDSHGQTTCETHGHAHAEGSDLDRTVAELFAEQCEHDMPAHRCDECRYEVGVAKVSRDLIDRGLVQTGEVAEHRFASEIELTGEVRFDERKIAHLGPRAAGIVRQVTVDLGQEVSAGQVLVELDSAELAEAEAVYLEAVAEAHLAKKAFDRRCELHEAQISSEREFLEAEQQSEAATIRTNAARQKLLRFGMDDADIAVLERAGIHGANGSLLLRAPFDGEVLMLQGGRGELVEPGGDLVLLGDTRTLWVWVDLYETHLGMVSGAKERGGLPATVTVRAYPGEEFHGELDFIDRVMDEDTRTVKARITLDNPGGRLRPGMFAEVRLAIAMGRAFPAVPAAAVLADDGRDFVFVRHTDDYFVRRPLTTGRTAGGYVEVLEGLQTGQIVAVSGAFLLKSDVLRSKMGAGCAH
jgi:cobalt-zinc-cadmium efflux system membrane fusion protein